MTRRKVEKKIRNYTMYYKYRINFKVYSMSDCICLYINMCMLCICYICICITRMPQNDLQKLTCYFKSNT